MDDIPSEKRLPASVISHRANSTPDMVVVLLPKGQALEDDFFGLTYRRLNYAVDNVAFWLDSVLSQGKKVGYESESQWSTIVYAGSNDDRYVLLLYAVGKTNRKAGSLLFPSSGGRWLTGTQPMVITLPTNPKDSLIKLLNAQGVKTALASRVPISPVKDAMDHILGGQVLDMPPLSTFLDAIPPSTYPYDREWSKTRNDTWLVMQSSGTTGDPKPVTQTKTFIDAYADMIAARNKGDNLQLAYPVVLRDCHAPLLWPLSWGAGIFAAGMFPLVSITITTLIPPTMPSPMTPEYVKDVMRLVPRAPRIAC